MSNVTGRVVDENGFKMPGLVVQAVGKWLLTSDTLASDTTDGDGQFILEARGAGVTMSSDEFSFSDDNAADWIEVNTIEFETWILDEQTNTLRRGDAELPKPAKPPLFYQLSAHLFVKQASFGAAGNSELRRSGSARYRTTTVGKYSPKKVGPSSRLTICNGC